MVQISNKTNAFEQNDQSRSQNFEIAARRKRAAKPKNEKKKTIFFWDVIMTCVDHNQ